MNKHFLQKLFNLLLLLTLSVPVQADILLPDLGNTASTQMTAEEEEAQGHHFYLQLKQAGYILEDPFIDSYINQLGQNLVNTLSDNNQSFKFFIVNNPHFNAFAMLGGYIGVNTGLILASEKESELASVLAHEITHVSQQHLLRIMEKMGQQQGPIAAPIIAAILLGQSNPMVAQATLYSAIATQAQSAISYTRQHEHEADRIGIQMLADAGYDPRSMADFFSTMEERYRYQDNSLPEYLRTHPVTTNRIAEARDRAEQIPSETVTESINFNFVKARIRIANQLEYSPIIKNLEVKNKNLTMEERYTLTLAYIAEGQFQKAHPLSQHLLMAYPQNVAIMETHAHLLHILGKKIEAHELLVRGLKLYPHNQPLTLELAEQYLDSNELEKARSLLNEHTERKPSAIGYQLLAKVENRAGNSGYSHFYLAKQHIKLKQYPLAMTQLRYAKEDSRNDFYLTSRVNALMNTIKPHLDKLKKQEQLRR